MWYFSMLVAIHQQDPPSKMTRNYNTVVVLTIGLLISRCTCLFWPFDLSSTRSFIFVATSRSNRDTGPCVQVVSIPNATYLVGHVQWQLDKRDLSHSQTRAVD
jgi:hypothetical protein